MIFELQQDNGSKLVTGRKLIRMFLDLICVKMVGIGLWNILRFLWHSRSGNCRDIKEDYGFPQLCSPRVNFPSKNDILRHERLVKNKIKIEVQTKGPKKIILYWQIPFFSKSERGVGGQKSSIFKKVAFQHIEKKLILIQLLNNLSVIFAAKQQN